MTMQKQPSAHPTGPSSTAQPAPDGPTKPRDVKVDPTLSKGTLANGAAGQAGPIAPNFPATTEGSVEHAGSGPRGQGEGDYASAARYQRDAQRFAESGQVAEKADEAKKAVEDPAQAKKLIEAEKAGRSRAAEEDRLLFQK